MVIFWRGREERIYCTRQGKHRSKNELGGKTQSVLLKEEKEAKVKNVE